MFTKALSHIVSFISDSFRADEGAYFFMDITTATITFTNTGCSRIS